MFQRNYWVELFTLHMNVLFGEILRRDLIRRMDQGSFNYIEKLLHWYRVRVLSQSISQN